MEDNQCWTYQGKCLEKAPDGWYGFVYCITDDQGKKYWGKKAFSHRVKKTLSKRARVGTRKRVKVEQVDSKWLGYWGSSKQLLEYINDRGSTEGFRRDIVKLCEDRQSLTYWELTTLIMNGVLFRDDTWNGNILGKFFKGKVHE